MLWHSRPRLCGGRVRLAGGDAGFEVGEFALSVAALGRAGLGVGQGGLPEVEQLQVVRGALGFARSVFLLFGGERTGRRVFAAGAGGGDLSVEAFSFGATAGDDGLLQGALFGQDAAVGVGVSERQDGSGSRSRTG